MYLIDLILQHTDNSEHVCPVLTRQRVDHSRSYTRTVCRNVFDRMREIHNPLVELRHAA